MKKKYLNLLKPLLFSIPLSGLFLNSCSFVLFYENPKDVPNNRFGIYWEYGTLNETRNTKYTLTSDNGDGIKKMKGTTINADIFENNFFKYVFDTDVYQYNYINSIINKAIQTVPILPGMYFDDTRNQKTTLVFTENPDLQNGNIYIGVTDNPEIVLGASDLILSQNPPPRGIETLTQYLNSAVLEHSAILSIPFKNQSQNPDYANDTETAFRLLEDPQHEIVRYIKDIVGDPTVEFQAPKPETVKYMKSIYDDYSSSFVYDRGYFLYKYVIASNILLNSSYLNSDKVYSYAPENPLIVGTASVYDSLGVELFSDQTRKSNPAMRYFDRNVLGYTNWQNGTRVAYVAKNNNKLYIQLQDQEYITGITFTSKSGAIIHIPYDLINNGKVILPISDDSTDIIDDDFDTWIWSGSELDLNSPLFADVDVNNTNIQLTLSDGTKLTPSKVNY